MKKTCKGCKALQLDIENSVQWICALRYNFDPDNKVPLEECVKPRTCKALMENSRRFGGI